MDNTQLRIILTRKEDGQIFNSEVVRNYEALKRTHLPFRDMLEALVSDAQAQLEKDIQEYHAQRRLSE